MMPKEKKQDKLNDPFLKWLEEEDDPFGLNEDLVIVDFQCLKCKKIDEVPEYLIGEFQFGLKKNEEVELECPFCGGTMRQKRDSPKG
jgi:hypothetical protein